MHRHFFPDYFSGKGTIQQHNLDSFAFIFGLFLCELALKSPRIFGFIFFRVVVVLTGKRRLGAQNAVHTFISRPRAVRRLVIFIRLPTTNTYT